MKPLLLAGALLLAACSPAAQTKIDTALASPAGQLFCSIQLGGGGSIVAGIVKVGVTAGAAAVPGAAIAAPAAVLATDQTKAFVDAACAAAALSVAGAKSGVPVSPPAAPDVAPKIAVKV